MNQSQTQQIHKQHDKEGVAVNFSTFQRAPVKHQQQAGFVTIAKQLLTKPAVSNISVVSVFLPMVTLV
jgi:hypothetical protein